MYVLIKEPVVIILNIDLLRWKCFSISHLLENDLNIYPWYSLLHNSYYQYATDIWSR